MTTQSSAVIFIIDDMPANLGILDEFLTDKGFQILIAQDGESALPKIEKAQPHLVLLDILMPKIDGFEVCRRLKANPKTQAIPVIFMTALTDTLDKIKGFELGAVDYVTKPFQQEEVLARIQTHLSISQLQQQLQVQNLQLQTKNTELDALATALGQKTEELRMANAELARAARLKDEFLANMSHELRTPLNAVLGMTEVLQEGIYGQLNNQQIKSIHTIEESGRHLLSLINDILDLAKIEAGKIKLDIIPLSAKRMGEICLHLTQKIAQKKSITLQWHLDQAVTLIQADERYLKQILLNLLNNAIKFTPTEGTVTLEIIGHLDQESVHLRVSDTGIGIATADMKYLFKPFIQLDGGLNRQHEGTGLGLALIYRLTEMHGGSVSIDSELGKGSCFTVALPWQPTEDSVSSPIIDLPSVTETTIMPTTVILLADDNMMIIDTVSEFLKIKGYQVQIAQNGIQAIERAREIPPNLILMDIQMPEMDGLEAIRRIRSEAKLTDIPIIAWTALAMPGDRERCLTAGASAYLSKPVNFKQLTTLIETWLSQS